MSSTMSIIGWRQIVFVLMLAKQNIWSSRTDRKLLYLTNIKIGYPTIEETNNIKFLGIIFDKHLRFKNYADVIARKISKSVGKLFKFYKYLPLEIIKTIYFSLISPFLLYGIEVWHGTYANITNKTFILKKKAWKAIHNLSFNTHITEYFKNAKN